jgi:hypothetical protein
VLVQDKKVVDAICFMPLPFVTKTLRGASPSSSLTIVVFIYEAPELASVVAMFSER